MSVLQELHTIVRDIVELTDAPPPEVLADDAPVLAESAVSGDDTPFYLVGLIGGKNVGKSSFVNALVGEEITARSSHGPGTETVVAYAHRSRVEPLRDLLEREVPTRYEIVPHDNESLARQVLLDLPDIDSLFANHRETTQRMLRHMLFPIWLQSVEKYADRRPKELLQQVTAGNDPGNIVFCLNKIDQLASHDGDEAIDALRDEYAGRLAEALSITPPRVWTISALQPDQADLPALREMLACEKPEEQVKRSRELAAARQVQSLLAWVDAQRLEERRDRLDAMEQDAREQLMDRVGGPLLERLSGHLLDDPALKGALAGDLMDKRVRRWPIVNILHVLLGPLTSAFRYRLSLPQQQAVGDPSELVRQHLTAHGRPLTDLLRASFARLNQLYPDLDELYDHRGPWQQAAAEEATTRLQEDLTQTIEHQQAALRSRMTGGGPIAAVGRWLVTLGALIWFPFVQPVLEVYLSPQGIRDAALLAVQVLGVTYLLKNVAFLAAWFVGLWLLLRWSTSRRAERWLERLGRETKIDPALSFSHQALAWIDDLLSPIRRAGDRTRNIIERIDRLRASLA